jgi:energy-coupling factor transporter ATP-binding protein EcfA2
MEKMICSLALRVALINLSSLSRPDIFIIDEGFGTLDQDSLTKCMDLLTMFKSYFRTIMVITHVDPIKEVADKIIDIYNDGLEIKSSRSMINTNIKKISVRNPGKSRGRTVTIPPPAPEEETEEVEGSEPPRLLLLIWKS